MLYGSDNKHRKTEAMKGPISSRNTAEGKCVIWRHCGPHKEIKDAYPSTTTAEKKMNKEVPSKTARGIKVLGIP